MTVAVLIATYGDLEWSDLAQHHAMPSVLTAGYDDATRVHLPDGTLAEARNLAAASVDADWLLFLDADDQLGEGYKEAMAEHLWYTTDLITGQAKAMPYLLAPKIESDAMPGSAEHPNRGRTMEDLNHCCIGTLVPRWLFVAVGGFRELPVYEDWDLWLRCLRHPQAVHLGAHIIYTDAVYIADLTAGRNLPPYQDRLKTYRRIRAEHQEALSSAA